MEMECKKTLRKKHMHNVIIICINPILNFLYYLQETLEGQHRIGLQQPTTTTSTTTKN